jgi:hypothetical protein
VIAHKVGDEKSPAFWRILASSDLQSLLSKDTAVFTLRAILVLAQVIGYRAHRMSIHFTSDPVSDEGLKLLESLKHYLWHGNVIM